MDSPPPAVEAVEVLAPRLPVSPADAAFSVVRVAPEVLAAAPRLDDALRSSSGLSLFRRTSSAGANPTTQGLSLRAIAPSGAGRALVLLDGAPQNDPFGGWVIWSALPPEALSAAAVTRGAGAGPYGAGALTGTVSLQERDRVPGGLVGQAAVDGLGGARAAVAAEGEARGARAFVSAAVERGPRWFAVRDGRGAADARLAMDAWTLAGRLTFAAGETVSAVRAGAFQERRGSGLVGANSQASGLFAGAVVARPPAPGRDGWRVQAWARTSDLRNRSVAVAPGRTGTTPANDQYETPALGLGANAALRRVRGPATLEAGLDARFAEGESRELFRYMGGGFTRDRRAGGRISVAGAYAEGALQSGGWLLTGGARIDGWRSWDARRTERDLAGGPPVVDERPAGASGTVPTGRIGVRRDLGGGLHLRGAAYSGFRPPTLNELHRPFRVGNDVTEANAALKPERLYGAEAGAGWAGAGAFVQAAVFAARLDDPIANVTVGAGPATFPVAGFIPAGGVLRQRRNVGRIEAVGLEVEAGAGIGRDLSLRGSMTLVEAEVDGGSAAPRLTGLRPAQTPRLSATAGATWRVSERVSAFADLRYEGRRFEDDLNSRVLGASTTVDVRVQARLTGDWAVFAGVDNLTNARVETGETADGIESFERPRTARLGLVLRR